MRIDDLNRAPQGTPGTQASDKSGTAGKAHSSPTDSVAGSEGSDQAEVSTLAQSLAAPDPGRIEELRLQVESGTFEVSAHSLANALIDAHLGSAHLGDG
jgi:flagellar biosynthesis anti-sigma factor FlgM